MAKLAPVEVWEIILKYSIAVPLFFSSDPIVEHGFECLPRFCFEAEYWDSERTRNNCRRVCHSWDVFLQRYGHRYVRLPDIYYGRIPLEAMSMAIRLNVTPEWRFNIHTFTEFSRTSALVTSYLTPTGEDGELVKEWRMEILEGYNHNLLMSCLENAPQLRAVINPRSWPGQARPKAAGVRFLYTDPTRANAPSEPLVLQHLTTLHLISYPSKSLKDVPFKDWRLPSLQHLSIDAPLEDRGGFGDVMLDIVRAIGKNLITLHFQGVFADCLAPNIWPHIPHVERIQMPYWKGALRPADHPARIVTVSFLDFSWVMKHRQEQPAMDLFNYLPHPKQFSSHCLIVKMDLTWLATLPERRAGTCCRQPYHDLGSAIWLAEYYEHLGVEFTDAEGVNLQDYLVFAIKFYWKGRRASVHPRKENTANRLYF